MVKINLRSWREERNEQAQKKFTINLLLTVLLAVSMILALGAYYDYQTQRQVDRNNYLNANIDQLKVKIKEIENLKKLKDKRLARLNTIQTLQGNRPLTVRYFDELVRVLPEELYYVSLVRVGEKLTVIGLANRNQDVSQFMRNLDRSQWFGEPNLSNVGSLELDRRFNLDVQLTKGGKVD